MLGKDLEGSPRRWLWSWEPKLKTVLCENQESAGDVGKGAKKLGGAKAAGAVQPRWTLGHASLLGSWGDTSWHECRGWGHKPI